VSGVYLLTKKSLTIPPFFDTIFGVVCEQHYEQTYQYPFEKPPNLLEWWYAAQQKTHHK